MSAYPVEPYGVLPQQAGLAQLMEQGLIKRQGNAFLVLQPIPRFPAGLHGAPGVSFLLGPDLPLPAARIERLNASAARLAGRPQVSAR